MIYGDADDPDVRYEPDTTKRFASVLHLVATTTYLGAPLGAIAQEELPERLAW